MIAYYSLGILNFFMAHGTTFFFHSVLSLLKYGNVYVLRIEFKINSIFFTVGSHEN